MWSKSYRHVTRQWRRRAVTLIWVALGGLIFIGFVGLAMDTGHVLFAGQQLQIAADAASLAAARYVRSDVLRARAAARDTAAHNYVYGIGVQLEPNNGNAAGGDIVVGIFNRFTNVFTPTETDPNAVQVTARRTAGSPSGALPLIFARGWGVSTSDVTRDATAICGGEGAGLIVLSPNGNCALSVQGTATLNVIPAPPNTCDIYGAGIQVNSTNNHAACANGNPIINTTGINITGPPNSGGSNMGNNTTLINPCPNSPTGMDLIHTQQPCIPDPLGCVACSSTSGIGACISEPDPVALGLIDQGGREYSSSGSNATLPDSPSAGPGPYYWYSGGIKITGGKLTLKPGIYILGSDDHGATGLNISGGPTVCAKGVMLVIRGRNGVLDITGGSDCPGGTGGINISPIPTSGTPVFCNASYSDPGIPLKYRGISIFQSRSNDNQARIIGSSCLNITGTLYFPDNDLLLGGTGSSFGNQIIAFTVSVQGTANITIPYDGRNTAFGNTGYLVE